jgi:1,4-alpha-glucan branching enzyme
MMYYHHGLETIDSRDKYFKQGVEYDAVTYLQLANELIHQLNPAAVSIAEDVTGMPGLTSPVADGGLGFNYRLGMGIPDFWIKLLKEYQDEDWSMQEVWHVLNDRLPHVKTVTYAESHDQALVGDKTIAFRLMDKEMYFHMKKDDPDITIERGIALHKLIRLFTISLGGNAYMNFMGNEFGHPEWIDFPREGNNWSYKYARRQWSLEDNPILRYQGLAEFDKAMIHLIKSENCLEQAFPFKHFDNEYDQVLAYERGSLLFVFNFNPVQSFTGYGITIPQGKYQLVLNSDDEAFGGFHRLQNGTRYFAQKSGKIISSQPFYIQLYLPNRTALVLKKLPRKTIY